MKKILLLLITFLSFATAQSQGFEISGGQFVLNGKPMRIYGGEMHYARIPRQYWRQRIQMVRAMGCNTISIYVFWNYHETAPGVWDWTSDSHDLRAFVELARAEGMYIILRPGPYTCAEWEFGGLPYWVMNSPIRSDDETYLHLCRTYLSQVYHQVDGLFAEQGGNILMTQVENEYGFYAFDAHVSKDAATAYKTKILAVYRDAGFTHTLFTCDGGIIPIVNFARMGHIDGIFPGTNDSHFLATAHHTVRRFFDKKGPYYIPEEYAGWFTHWGDAHVFHRDVEKYKTHIEKLLKTDFSFCYYMIHGGTNFGFMNGANSRPQNEVWPVVTSYDYGAPIDEAGHATPLYDSLRAVYQRYSHQALPPVPAPIPSMAIDSIRLTAVRLFKTLADYNVPYLRNALSFEIFGQAYGYLLYERKWDEAQRGQLSAEGITDYARIYVNDSLIATIDRDGPPASIPHSIALDIPKGGTVRVLVENMGRINFGKKMLANKRGMVDGFVMDGKEVLGWLIYGLPPRQPQVATCADDYAAQQPIYYSGTFDLRDTADTYLDMHGFGKGCAFINGHNLGRFWEIGPQYSLYVPGVWLHEGKNEIVIFDELNRSQQHSIRATARPVNR